MGLEEKHVLKRKGMKDRGLEREKWDDGKKKEKQNVRVYTSPRQTVSPLQQSGCWTVLRPSDIIQPFRHVKFPNMALQGPPRLPFSSHPYMGILSPPWCSKGLLCLCQCCSSDPVAEKKRDCSCCSHPALCDGTPASRL